MKAFLNIYKPQGITSFDVIAKLRKKLKIKQIGHGGTLDPLAEGVLPIALGKTTRLLEYLNEDKEYICECELGKISDTYDLEGEVVFYSDKKVVLEEVQSALKNFLGEIEQIPPAYSAVHYNGKRLYELARKGEIPEDIPKRKITVYENELLEFDVLTQKLKFKVACSKGTYIRSIVHDLGMFLGTGAVMTKLIRTKSSGLDMGTAVKLDEFLSNENVEKFFIHPQTVLPLKQVVLALDEYQKIKNGQIIQKSGDFSEQEMLAMIFKNELIGIGKYLNGTFKAQKNLV